MKAITLHRSNGSSELSFCEIETPKLENDTHVLVRLKAAGINPIDLKISSNPDNFPLSQPIVPGCDGAGIVESVGSAVKDFKSGDEVYFCQIGFNGQQGCYAQYNVLEQSCLSHKPASLSFSEAAAIPLVLITAWEALFNRASLQKDQTVFIPAGAGGVGHIAIQLAKLNGAKVCTSVSNSEKAQFVETLGADKIINYRQQDVVTEVQDWTDGKGVDLSLDTLGGKVFKQCIDCTRIYGDTVTILQPQEDFNWSEARLKNLSIKFELMLSPTLLSNKQDQSSQTQILKQCVDLFDSGKLSINVAVLYPLSEANLAQRHLQDKSPIGKVILDIP